MQYAGFWVRAGATVVDGLVLVPVTLVYWSLATISWEVAVIATVPYVWSSAAYNVYFHARWGQTLGKMAQGIKVVTLGGQPIGWRHALLRHSVDMVVAAASSVAWLLALLAASPAAFEGAGFVERMDLAKEARGEWLRTVGVIWTASELVVLLLNEKRRAIHDYLAGTVVVVLPRGRARSGVAGSAG